MGTEGERVRERDVGRQRRRNISYVGMFWRPCHKRETERGRRKRLTYICHALFQGNHCLTQRGRKIDYVRRRNDSLIGSLLFQGYNPHTYAQSLWIPQKGVALLCVSACNWFITRYWWSSNNILLLIRQDWTSGAASRYVERKWSRSAFLWLPFSLSISPFLQLFVSLSPSLSCYIGLSFFLPPVLSISPLVHHLVLR